jgi:hypothetical protein
MKFCSENQKNGDHLEDLSVDERILKWILKDWGSRVWSGIV